VFHSESGNEPPGCAKGESLNNDPPHLYEKLAKIDNWRKVLYNFWREPFEHAAILYMSAAHAYNAQYFLFMADMRSDEKRREALRHAKKFAVEFSTLTGSQIHKVGKADGPRLTAYEAKKWEMISEEKLAEVVQSKFRQCDIAKTVLLHTGRSTLVHRMHESARLYHWWSFLEDVREELREEESSNVSI